MEKIVNRMLKNEVFSHCVIGIYNNGRKSLHSYGKADSDSIFDIASITKAITFSGLIKLIEDGKIKLSDKVNKFIPNFIGKFTDEVTVKHIASYLVIQDIPKMEYKKIGVNSLPLLLNYGLSENPGKSFRYTNLSAILAGLIIEKVSKKSLDIFLNDLFFKPFGMKDTRFFPKNNQERIVPTEYDENRGGLLIGKVHDPTAYNINKAVGCAGIFSTAKDLLVFGKNLFLEKLILKEKTLKEIGKNQLKEVYGAARYGLGWDIISPGYSGHNIFDKNTVLMTGFTGCIILINSEMNLIIVVLTNNVFPENAMWKRKEMTIFRNEIVKNIASQL